MPGIFSLLHRIYKHQNRRKLFFDILKNNSFDLDYISNIEETDILKEIFYDRCYSEYFPFYQNAVIVDIGAHKGYFSIFASKNTESESKIFAIEPSTENTLVLKRNLKDNAITNVKVIEKSIYSENRKLELFLSKTENNSIFENYSKHLKSNNTDRIEVEAITLNNLFEKNNIEYADFVKIDCEGAEYPIIFSSDQKTLKKMKVISLEFHDLKDESYTGLKLVKFLENSGFKITKFIYEPTIINNNFGKIVAVRN